MKVKHSDWEAWYREEDVESMPWFLPGLDHDFESGISEFNLKSGRVLDLGTGPGTQAIELAARGFMVTATDISETAVQKAAGRAGRIGREITFVHDDILDTTLSGKFDSVFDRGCFHTLLPDRRHGYVRTVESLLEEGGYLFLKCFSHLEPGDEGPYRLSPGEITGCFEGAFRILDIRDSFFKGRGRPDHKALFCILRKP